MTTMGVTVYCNRVQIPGTEREQLMLLRTLQDNESNILGNRTQVIAPKSVLVANPGVPISGGVVVNSSNSMSGATSVVQQQVTTVLPPYDPTRLKKHGKNGQPPPVAVARRNARERNRVKQVNDGFTKLRSYIPSHVAAGYGDRGKKLSKVETLRMAVEYIRGLKRLLAEADGMEYDPNRGMEHGMTSPSPTGSVLSSSTHNGSGERLCMGDETPQQEEEDGDYLLEEEEDDEERRGVQRTSLSIRLSPNLRTSSSSTARRRRGSPCEYYAPAGDEENVEPKDSRSGFSRFSPPIASPVVVKNEFCAGQNEENLQPRTVLSPYSGSTEIVGEVLNPEEGPAATVIYSTSPEPFSGALYYKHEVSETGEFMDVVSWWEQEQGRLVHHPQPHAQRLTHV